MPQFAWRCRRLASTNGQAVSSGAKENVMRREMKGAEAAGMRALIGRCGLAGALLLSGGCAPLSKDQCKTANWQQIGYQSGVNGRSPVRYEEERQACAEHGIGSDETGWKIGYAQGLGVYCTAANGYDVGRHGGSYDEVCPPDLDARFRPAYQDGRHVADLLNALNERRSRLDDIGRILADDDKRARDYVALMRKNPQPPPPPPQLLERRARRDLEREYDYLRNEHEGLRRDFEQNDGELSARYAVPAMGYDGP
ncbi:DUF2799 domain-containing protein [Hydrocarboniphaga sp.]|nr:DUF2799 domain-containing protein [Hydrocarboniphaga sp.]MDZ4080426.1 DUF2799 domain-containing protein [Hydrocarboniphaga sp.]